MLTETAIRRLQFDAAAREVSCPFYREGTCQNCLLKLIDLRRQNEIAFRQSIDFMGPDGHFRFPPPEANVGMLTLLLARLANPIYKIKRFTKVAKVVTRQQMMLVDNLPVRDFRRERLDLFTLHRR